MEKAFIFDIDGTLAKMNGRSPYDYSKVSEDKANARVAELHDILASGYHIIYCSGRPDSCANDTIHWLTMNLDTWRGVDLRMRKTGDKRPDDIVKKEILDDILREYEVVGVFDDRDRVVKMWRENGLQCYQVDYGDF